MKELYIAPELEILCFAPMEGIASNEFAQTYGLSGRNSDDPWSTGENATGDWDDPIDPEESLS